MRQRRFGTVSTPNDRDGTYIAFTVKGERRKRKVRNESDADRKLAAVEEMALSGRSMQEVRIRLVPTVFEEASRVERDEIPLRKLLGPAFAAQPVRRVTGSPMKTPLRR